MVVGSCSPELHVVDLLPERASRVSGRSDGAAALEKAVCPHRQGAGSSLTTSSPLAGRLDPMAFVGGVRTAPVPPRRHPSPPVA